MTRIVSFSVQGLSGRSEDVRYDLASDVNVFFGLNGTGKTSLLKILYAALRGKSETLRRVPFEGATVEFWSDHHHRLITRTISGHKQDQSSDSSEYDEVDPELLTVEQAEAMQVSQRAWTTKPKMYTDRGFRIHFMTTHRLAHAPSPMVRYQMQNIERMSEQSLDEIFALEVRQAWRQFNSRLLSDVRGIQSQGLADILQSFFAEDEEFSDGALFDKDAFSRASDFLARQGVKLPGTRGSFQARYTNDFRLRGVVNKIDRIERDIERAEQPRLQFQKLIEQFITEPKSLTFTDRDIVVNTGTGEQIDLTLLSSGEKQLVRLLLVAVTAGQSVVLFDEPELSLHIDWQRGLLDAMRTLNPDAQIIAATHSPEIMADLPDANIFRL